LATGYDESKNVSIPLKFKVSFIEGKLKKIVSIEFVAEDYHNTTCSSKPPKK